jgi:serine acetyltransferase
MRSPISEDVRLYHRLRYPDRQLTAASRLSLMLTSRGLWQLLVHRVQFSLHARRRQARSRHPGWLALAYLMTPFEILIKVIAKCELLPTTQLDRGIYLSDRGHVMLGARHIGRGSVIHHNVTIGVDTATGGLPQIGENVWIGPESIIFGAITIGEGSTVLEGSVLTRSVPARTVVQGNPARVVRRDFDNSALLTGLSLDTTAATAGICG